MPPKKRGASASPKKKEVKADELSDVIEDIETESVDGGDVPSPAESPSPAPPPAKRGRPRKNTEGSETAAKSPAKSPAKIAASAAAAAPAEAAAAALVAAKEEEDDEMEKIIISNDIEDAEPTEAELPEEEQEQPSADAAAAAPKAEYKASKGVLPATLPLMDEREAVTTPSRRVPRLKLADAQPSADVREAGEIEDAAEREGGVRRRWKDSNKAAAAAPKEPRVTPAAIRRPTSPARTRAFTQAATLSAVMKESKERLRKKREVTRVPITAAAISGGIGAEVTVGTSEKDGEPVKKIKTDGEGEEEERVDVENDIADIEEETGEISCQYCNKKFPLKLEMQEHQLNAHKSVATFRRDPGILLCAHPHCGIALSDMHAHLAHLSGFHNQTQFRIRQQHFQSEESFMAWKSELEQRSKMQFIARNEEIELEPGVTELELYCEGSEEWRNADKDKGLSPIVGCPAHFTVRLDRNKDKVTIIGCVSHLGHLKKPNWTTYAPDGLEGAKKRAGGGGGGEGEEGVVKQSKCHLCGEWFRSRTALTIHRKTIHPDNIRTPTLTCGDPTCDVVTDTMLALCEHVADVHKREDLVVEEYRFNSIQDFEVWKERMEADTMSFFTKVSGRQRAATSGPNSECFFRYYQCHLSGYNQGTRGRKGVDDEMERIRIRNRGTKKMNRYCTAFMNIKINDVDGTVLLKGCLGHFGHECDIRRVPMPASLRAEIVDLLQKGITEDDVITIVKGKASVHDRAYYLQKYEVKNIVKKLIKESNGAVFYKYDDEDDLVEEEMGWNEMKRPYGSSMYRSMMTHPKRRSMGTYAMQFSAQVPRKRRLVYRQDDSMHAHHGEEYYESVVEEMAVADMDEHVTYLEEEELAGPSSSHHRMMMQEREEREMREPGEVGEDGHGGHEEEEEEEMEEATSSSRLVRRKMMPVPPGAAVCTVQQQQLQHGQMQQLQQLGAAGQLRTPLLKDGSINNSVERDRNVDFMIYNIRKKIMTMTEQVKRCKNPAASAAMLNEVRQLETRMARIIPQTGSVRLETEETAYDGRTVTDGRRRDRREREVRRARVAGEEVVQHVAVDEEDEVEEEYYEEQMVVEDGDYYELAEEEEVVEEEEGGRREGRERRGGGGRRGQQYQHHGVMYEEVGDPGVEVDVEDLEEMDVLQPIE